MNDSEDLLSIGEVSGICRISVKTLRHYDKLGIIKPALVDSINGYRYYSKSQLPFIGYVREMRLLGFSLAEILRCFEKENVFKWEKVIPLIDEKLDQITKQLEKLLKVRQQFVAWKQLHIETGLLNNIQSGNVKVKYVSPRIVAFSRTRSKRESHVMSIRVFELSNLIHENNLYHKGAIMAILHEDYRDFDHADADIEICWEVLAEKPFKSPFIREIPAGLYASVLHEGDYNTMLTETYPVLYNWIKEHNFQVTGPSIQIFHVSVQNAQSPDRFITEVQVSVIKNGE